MTDDEDPYSSNPTESAGAAAAMRAGLIGESPEMRRVFGRIEKASGSDATVVLVGESGTGKELAARAIHDSGPRREQPFIAVNCAAIAEGLMEGELFGHVRGAYTGATHDRVGLIEATKRGTLFLDEIEEVPLALQAKLLRVLQEREIRRVGATSTTRVDFRAIVATNRDLEVLLAERRLREDFYYRIRVFEIRLPLLRERGGDVRLLTEHMLASLCEHQGLPLPTVDAGVLSCFEAYAWPGNVRELHNALQHAVIMHQSGRIALEDLPEWLRVGAFRGEQPGGSQDRADGGDERTRIIEALRAAGGVRTKAADLLGYSRVTLWKKMREFAIDDDAL